MLLRLLCGIAALAHAAPARAADESGDGRAILDRAIARWNARPRPVHLAYTVTFDGVVHGRRYERVFRVDVDPASEAPPRVTTLRTQGSAPPLVDPQKQRFVANDTFGLVPSRAVAVAPSPEPTSLRVIATVRSTAPSPYDVRLTGIEDDGGVEAYHLVLTPRRDAARFPLRDAWVDTVSGDVRHLCVERAEHLGPLAVPYRLNVWYAAVGPYWLITRAASGATVRAGIFSYGSSAEAHFADFDVQP